jgi:hypothetical protein
MRLLEDQHEVGARRDLALGDQDGRLPEGGSIRSGLVTRTARIVPSAASRIENEIPE